MAPRTMADPTLRIQSLLDLIADYESAQQQNYSMLALASSPLVDQLLYIPTPDFVVEERMYQRVRGKYNEKNRNRMRYQRIMRSDNSFTPQTRGWKEREDKAVSSVLEELECTTTSTNSKPSDETMASPPLLETTRSHPSSRAQPKFLPTTEHTTTHIKRAISPGPKAGPQRDIRTIAAEMNADEPLPPPRRGGKLLTTGDVNLTQIKEAISDEISPARAAEIQRLIDEGKL